jgi:hypothetical protein
MPQEMVKGIISTIDYCNILYSNFFGGTIILRVVFRLSRESSQRRYQRQ